MFTVVLRTVDGTLWMCYPFICPQRPEFAPDQVCPDGNSLVHYAAKGNAVDVLSALKERGSSFRLKNLSNRTPLDEAHRSVFNLHER